MALRLGTGVAVAAACAAAAWLLPIGSTVAQPVKLKLARGTLRVFAPSVSATAAGAKAVTVTVTDARGVGTGWSLKLVAARQVKVSKLAARCAAHSTCTLPKASGVGPSPLVVHANGGSGMGVIKLTVTMAALARGTPATPVRFAVAG